MGNVFASIITIGDELLIGQTIDTNSAFIGQELNKIGIWVKRRIAIGDLEDEIIAALQEETNSSKLIILTGGLGPTGDDVTKAALCKYFKSELIVDNTALQNVKNIFINGVQFSLHPAGHIVGSAQIRIEKGGNILVVSGDYKTENDGISGEFEVVKCNTFITESTFGLPIFKWKTQNEIFEEINSWWQNNIENNKTSILIGYSLGKSQRLLKNIDATLAKIYLHGAVFNINETLRTTGVDLPFAERLTPDTVKADFKNAGSKK